MAGGNRLRRLAPAIGLLFLSPWVGEFLLGSSPIQHLPAALVLIVPMYGGGALLIREIARRFGRGYATIVLLGAAYGVVEAGLLDQSMFNPAFLEPESGPVTAVPPAVSVNNALGYVAGHAIWSITVPIAMIELMVPDRSDEPWLGKIGLAAATVLYLIGCVIVFSFIYAEHRFLASPVQLAGAAAAALLLIGIAFGFGTGRGALRERFVRSEIRRRVQAGTGSGAARSPIGRQVNPRLLGGGSFLASSLFVSRPENGAGIAVGIGLLLAAWFLVRRWSRCSWWSNRHRLALVSGAVLTYAWLGFVVTYLLWPDDWIAWCGNGLFAVIAIVLLVVISKRTKMNANIDEQTTP